MPHINPRTGPKAKYSSTVNILFQSLHIIGQLCLLRESPCTLQSSDISSLLLFPKKRNTPSRKGLESTVTTGRNETYHISMYDEFLRITQDRVPYTDIFLTSFLQDVMAISQSQLPPQLQKDNDVRIALQTLFLLLVNHPLLCNTTSIPGPPSTPREYIPFRLPFSFDLNHMCIQAALFTHDNSDQWNIVLTAWLMKYYSYNAIISDPSVIIIPIVSTPQSLNLAIPPLLTTLYNDNRPNSTYSLQGIIVDDNAFIF